MIADAVRPLIERLRPLGLTRLCARRRVSHNTSRDRKIDTLVVRYAGLVDDVVADLRREDLVELLAGLRFDVSSGTLEFVWLWRAKKNELADAVRAVFVEQWRPAAEGDAPTPSISTRFTAGPLLSPSSATTSLASQRLARSPEELPAYEEIFGGREAQRRELQPFQSDAIRSLREHFAMSGERAAQRGILCLPTGGGKTRTALEFLLGNIVGQRRVLWIAHRLELLDQVHRELREIGGTQPLGSRFSVSRFQSNVRDVTGDIVIASNASLLQQKPSREQFASRGLELGLVVFDEAHHAVADLTWEYLRSLLADDVHLLSLTATPYRTERGGTERLRQLLGEVVFEKSFRSLVDEGFLAEPIFVRQVLKSTSSFSLSEIERRALEAGDDFTAETLRRIAGTPGRDHEIVKHWLERQREFDKTIVFACDIEHADLLARRFSEHVGAQAVHSGLSRDERNERIEWFRRATGPCVLVNVGILTEGTNLPDTRCVLVARPTLSKALFHQMIGRGSRGSKTVPGKTHFTVIDCVDGHEHLGATLAGAGIAAELRERDDNEITTPTRDATATAASSPSMASARSISATSRELAWIADLSAALVWHRESGRAIDDMLPESVIEWVDGNVPRSIPVFAGSAPAVESALAQLRAAIAQQRWNDVSSRTASLDALGVVRPSHWARLVEFARNAGRAPVMVGVRMMASWAVERATSAVGALTGLLAQCCAREGHERAPLIAAAMATTPALALFDSAQHLERTIDELLADLRRSEGPAAVDTPAAAQTPSRSAAEAFVVLGAAVARADGAWGDAEARVMSKGLEAIFTSDGAMTVVPDDATCSDDESINVAIATLLRDLAWDPRSAVFDWLCRVAIADEQLHEAEAAMLELFGVRLGIEDEDVRRRIEWAADRDPNSSSVRRDGWISCACCGSVMQPGSVFCGDCGAKLGAGTATERDDVVLWCVECGEQNPRDARYCGRCRSELPLAESRGDSPSAPDFSTGAEAEELLVRLLKERWPEDSVDYSPREQVWPDGRKAAGESDIVLRRKPISNASRATREMHIEVKHLAASNECVYWSEREVRKAEEVRAKGLAYFMVIVRNVRSSEPVLCWLENPLEELLVKERVAQGTVTSAPLAPSDRWNPTLAWIDLTAPKYCVFEINVAELLARLPQAPRNLAPVEAWFARVERIEPI